MADLRSFMAAFGDHMDLIDTGGGDPNAKTAPLRNQTSLDNMEDIRDIMSEFAAKGYRGMNRGDAKANFDRLSVMLGTPTAIKLINTVDIFEQRPDIKDKSPEQKIQEFYNLGSNDQEVSDILKRVKSIGTGTTTGARESTDVGLKKIEGNFPTNGKKGDEKAAKKTEDVAKSIVSNL